MSRLRLRRSISTAVVGVLAGALFAVVPADIAVADITRNTNPSDASFVNPSALNLSILQGCGRYWPSVDVFTVERHGATNAARWDFRLSDSELSSLRCVANTYKSPYLELDFRLIDFGGMPNWDGYAEDTNLPGGMHDVGWADQASGATPGVTNVSVSSLAANTWYHATINWTDASGVYPITTNARLSFDWVPSHWSDPLNVREGPACVWGLGSPGWCIFGTTRAFVSSGYFNFLPQSCKSY